MLAWSKHGSYITDITVFSELSYEPTSKKYNNSFKIIFSAVDSLPHKKHHHKPPNTYKIKTLKHNYKTPLPFRPITCVKL